MDLNTFRKIGFETFKYTRVLKANLCQTSIKDCSMFLTEVDDNIKLQK